MPKRIAVPRDSTNVCVKKHVPLPTAFTARYPPAMLTPPLGLPSPRNCSMSLFMGLLPSSPCPAPLIHRRKAAHSAQIVCERALFYISGPANEGQSVYSLQFALAADDKLGIRAYSSTSSHMVNIPAIAFW